MKATILHGMGMMTRLAIPMLAAGMLAACGGTTMASGDGGDATSDARDERADASIDAVLDGADAASDSATTDDGPGDASMTDASDAGTDAMDVGTGSDGGTDASNDSGSSPTCSTCDNFTNATVGGRIAIAAVTEASGVVASRAHPGVLYIHNDSGDSARFWAIDTAGHQLGEFHVTGATAHDWEDISLGPCPSGTCIYLGDVGDNAVARAQYQMYRVPEPDVQVGRDVGVVNVTPQRFPFVYPNGSHNCETLMVHPNGRIYVVTKVANGMSQVFRFPMPLQANTEVTLAHVADLTIPAGASLTATGGDIHPCANRFLLRVYNRLYEYRVASNRPFEDVFAATPVMMPVAGEPQGEAVGYHPDGHGYYTLSEGMSQPVNDYGCR